MSSVLEEFKGINFKDKRLNERFGEIMQSLETSPSGVISKAFIAAKDQKAAYRFFQNENTKYQTMLKAHQERVKERCTGYQIILAIQDSTSICLNGARKATDMGRVGDLSSESPGLNVHTSLLVTPEKEVLGISDLHVFDRKRMRSRKRSKAHRKSNALNKETGKFLRAVTHTRKEIKSDVKLVWIADREGDFWDYFSKLNETRELFVQRVAQRRELQDGGEDYFSYLRKQPVIGHYTFEIPSRGGEFKREQRTANCEVRSAIITLKKPKQLPRELKTFEVRAIHVIENTVKAPLEWFLITNIECNSFEEILEKIQWYQTRWVIEELHRIVKSGCGVEEMRLEDAERLIKYLLLLFIVGMRILSMAKLINYEAEAPCTKAFSEEEWKILYIRKYKKKPLEDFVPTIKEAVRLLACLGGFYDYNKKRDPGTMTIWRGMQRLRELLYGMETIEILKNPL
jgi:hypothetical protein